VEDETGFHPADHGGREDGFMSELIDSRAHRVRTLKEVIRHLHAGEAHSASPKGSTGSSARR